MKGIRYQVSGISSILNRKQRLPGAWCLVPGASRGFSLVEVVIAAAIIGVGIAGILATFAGYERAAGASVPQVQAVFLAEEGIEAAKLMRDDVWSTTIGTYTVNSPYMLEWKLGAWTATTTKSEIDSMYYRTITFQNVYRDASDQITQIGGTQDTNTRFVTSSVSWLQGNATSTVMLSAYMSNLFNN